VKIRLIQAIVLQSCGPLLLLALSVSISRFFGPLEQGIFISLKSWADVLIAIGCFGFPQSVIIAINRFGAAKNSLYVATPIYVVIFIPLFIAICYFFGPTKNLPFIESFAVVVGVACIVLVNIWRGILLTVEDGIRFHLITALPTTMLVVVVAVGLGLGISLKTSLPYFYVACGLMAVGFGYLIFPWRMVKKLNGKPINFWRLIANGGDVFIQGLSNTLQIYFCFAWLRHVDGLASVGYFSMALVALNAFGFPLQSIAPMILNRWSKQGDRRALHSGAKEVKKALLFVALISIASILVAPFVATEVLGPNFADAVPAIQIMLLAILPLLVFRLASLRLVAVGQFRFNSVVVVGRSLLLICLLYLAELKLNGTHPATVAAMCWVTVEALAAIIISYRVGHVRNTLAVGAGL